MTFSQKDLVGMIKNKLFGKLATSITPNTSRKKNKSPEWFKLRCCNFCSLTPVVLQKLSQIPHFTQVSNTGQQIWAFGGVKPHDDQIHFLEIYINQQRDQVSHKKK